MRRHPSVCRAARETSRWPTPLELITEEPLASDNPLAAASLGGGKASYTSPPASALSLPNAQRVGPVPDFWIKRLTRVIRQNDFADKPGAPNAFGLVGGEA